MTSAFTRKLSAAALAILVTAPLGTIGIDRTCTLLLDDDSAGEGAVLGKE